MIILWLVYYDRYLNFSSHLTFFSIWCVPLIKSGSLNWPWSTKILGQIITRICQFISQSNVKHIMTSPRKNNNISSEGLDRHYHKYLSSSDWTRWDISDNVCLDLQYRVDYWLSYLCRLRKHKTWYSLFQLILQAKF